MPAGTRKAHADGVVTLKQHHPTRIRFVLWTKFIDRGR